MKHVEREFAGRTLKLEAGRLAKQAAGSCLVQYGETVVLAAVTVSDNIANLPYFLTGVVLSYIRASSIIVVSCVTYPASTPL